MTEKSTSESPAVETTWNKAWVRRVLDHTAMMLRKAERCVPDVRYGDYHASANDVDDLCRHLLGEGDEETKKGAGDDRAV